MKYQAKKSNCKLCNNEFTVKMFTQKYCCRKCKQKAEGLARSKKPKTKICGQCSDVFTPYSSLDKFCSPKCRIEKMKSKRSRRWNESSTIKRMGENNPAYVHGLRSKGVKRTNEGLRLFHKNKKEYRQNLIDKKGYLYCERCDKTGCRFEAHHIIFRSEKPGHPNLHDKENIINVCCSCHNWFHNKKSNRNTLVESRNLHLIFGNEVLNK